MFKTGFLEIVEKKYLHPNNPVLSQQPSSKSFHSIQLLLTEAVGGEVENMYTADQLIVWAAQQFLNERNR